MAVEQGTGGATGGGLCTISTSDLVGLVDNLLQWKQDVTRLLELLTGMDIATSSIDQISQNLGTMTNATLINAARGWITAGTFSGVAISTLGWTMSDGNVFPVVVMQDGVLQFGFDVNGNISGAAVGLGGKFAYVKSTADLIASGPAPDSGSATWEISKNDASLVSLSGSTGFQVGTSGFYLVSMAVGVTTNNAADGHAFIQCGFTSQGTGAQDIDGSRNIGPRIYVPISTAFGPASNSYVSSRFMYIDSGATGTVQANTVGAGLTAGVGEVTVSLILLHPEQLAA